MQAVVYDQTSQTPPASLSADEMKRRMLEAEYNALRDEIVKRLEAEHRVINYALAAMATLTTLSYSNQLQIPKAVLLLYPWFAFFLAAEWAFNNMRVCQIGAYLLQLEQAVGWSWQGLKGGWEYYLHQSTLNRHPLSKSLTAVFIAYGVFPVTQAAAIVIAFRSSLQGSPEDLILGSLDALLVAFTILLIFLSEQKRYHPGNENQEKGTQD